MDPSLIGYLKDGGTTAVVLVMAYYAARFCKNVVDQLIKVTNENQTKLLKLTDEFHVTVRRNQQQLQEAFSVQRKALERESALQKQMDMILNALVRMDEHYDEFRRSFDDRWVDDARRQDERRCRYESPED